MSQAFVEIRGQHSVGGNSRGFGGPDTYVAVQIVPDNVKPLKQLNKRVAELRGIKIVYFGEGYASRQATTRSALGKAIAEAEAFADAHNEANYDPDAGWADGPYTELMLASVGGGK